MRRTQIYLDHEQIAELERVASRSGRTVSHLIREAIERTYGTGGDAERLLEALRTSAGAWRRRQGGAAHVERLRGGRLGRLLRGEGNRR